MPEWHAQLKKQLSLSGGVRRFVAVDFDSRRLRIVQAERVGDRMCIGGLSSQAMPDGIDIADARAVGEFLGSALRKLHLGRLPVVMNVPRGQAVLKTVSLPPGTPATELAGMVRYQVEKELPFRLDEAVIDFTVEMSHYGAGSSNQQSAGVGVLVAAVRLPVVDYYRQVALAAGVKLQRLGLRPYANHSCVDACTKAGADEPRALVHLTADETEIDVLIGQSLSFSRSAVGRTPLAGSGGDAAEEAVAGVVTEAIRSLQSYQSVEHGGQVSHAYVAGGTGIERRVAEALGERLGVPCQVLDVAQGLSLRGAGEDASEFVSALGLAIGHSADEGLRFDFLNPKRPVVQRDMRKLKWAAVAAAVILVMAVGLAARASYFNELDRQVRVLSDERKELEKVYSVVKAKETRAASIRSWEKKSRRWLDHLAYLSCLFPSSREAYITGLKANGNTLTFTIRAASEQVITEITTRLNKSGYDVKPGRQNKGKEGAYPHAIDVTMTPETTQKMDLASVFAQTRPSDDIGTQGGVQSSSSGGMYGGASGGTTPRSYGGYGEARGGNQPTPTPTPATDPNNSWRSRNPSWNSSRDGSSSGSSSSGEDPNSRRRYRRDGR